MFTILFQYLKFDIKLGFSLSYWMKLDFIPWLEYDKQDRENLTPDMVENTPGLKSKIKK